LNTGTLAIFLFVALAYLTSIRGREIETKGSNPKIFTVSPGATVTWINHDKVPHVISSTDNQFQKSPVLQPRQSFSSIFCHRRNLLLLLFYPSPDDRNNYRQVNVQPYHT
jgi:hypothetical protein